MRTLKERVRHSVGTGVRQRIWAGIIDHPVLSRAYYRLDPDIRDMRLRRETDLVVEGFPRSANTYTTEAILYANPQLTLTHHLHQPRIVEWAVERNVPTILTIRQPDAVVSSFTAFSPETPAEAVYTAYADYYQRLLPLVPRLVVADFSELTTSIARVAASVRERYGLDLHTPVPEDEPIIVARVEEFSAQHFGLEDFESKVARPSEHRLRRRSRAAAVSPEVRERACATYRAVHDAKRALNEAPTLP